MLLCIHLKPGAVLRRCGCMKWYGQPELTFIKRQVDMLLVAGLIIPVSCSEWLALIVVAAKKGPDMFRFCVGYCALNEASIIDGYPLPNVDAVLEA